MRIALIYHQFVSTGGMEKYLVAFAGRLLEMGHDLEVVTARTDPATEAMPVRFHRLPRWPPWPRWPMASLRLADFARRAEALARALPADITIGFGRTVAHDVHRAGGGCHAAYSRLLPPVKRLSWKNRLELSLEAQLYTSGKTRHFVVNSAKVAAELQDTYGVPPDRMTVIHTAVDTTLFRPAESAAEREAARASFGFRPGECVLLFVSSGHRRKGLGVLLEALRLARDVEGLTLCIAGQDLSRAERRVLERHQLSPRVRSLGPRDDLPELYRAADFFVHPTLYDACANTVLQSMASALPGIISARDGAAEFIDPGVNGFLLENPADPAGLSAFLRDAAALSEPRRTAIGARARATVLPLTWQTHLEKWERLFAALS